MSQASKYKGLAQFQKAFIMRHLDKVKAMTREQGTIITAAEQKKAKAAVERTLLAQNKKKR